MRRKAGLWRFAWVLALGGALALGGCAGDDGDDGAPGTSVGSITGTVTNEAAGAALEGVTVTAEPGGRTTTTDANGAYSLPDLPIGPYTLTFAKDGFAAETESVAVTAGETRTVDVALAPDSPVVVDVTLEGDAQPGATMTASVSVTPYDGSQVQEIRVTQSNSVEVAIEKNEDGTFTITLPDRDAYKAELLKALDEPAIGPDELPENVPVPEEGEGREFLLDRFYVLGINPFALEEAGHVGLTVTVETTSGTYTKTVDIHTELPWSPAAGLRNAPIGVPVLLQGAEQEDYDWSLTAPSGSAAQLVDAQTRNPEFTPDVPGLYAVTEANSGETLEIYAARWEGGLTALDGDGRPVLGACTGCHDGDPATAYHEFEEWPATGHAEIFTDNLNRGSAGHYGEGCFVCHTVGWDDAAANAGFDDLATYDLFLEEFFPEGHPAGGSDNFNQFLQNFPEIARLSNIQCENCHGPNGAGGAHTNGIGNRVSLSSDLCAVCHGEPLRHARFQQWQLSGHANMELALEEGTRGSCARCHTANGFIAWAELGFDPGETPEVAWTPDEIQPQTCVACHDPHAIGTQSGTGGGNATVRVQNDTPELAAGYRVVNAGRGAICMVCHNTRRGEVVEQDLDEVIVNGRAPHGGAQADVLMGQNAFFVEVGVRGKHSLIEDTCANCHMVQTPPPDLLAYNRGGTNHTFYASKDICANCHTSITAEEMENTVGVEVDLLGEALRQKIAELLMAYVDQGLTVTLTNMTDPADESATLDDVILQTGDQVEVTHFADSHGRQAMDVKVTRGGEEIVYGHLQLRHVNVEDGTLLTYGAADGEGPGELIAKAGWNYLLIENDGSHGIHNPSFAVAVVTQARRVVEGIEAPAGE
ncbi:MULTISPECIES: carboxypeptidase regulatory-like domain-containing protein [Deferrisoma]